MTNQKELFDQQIGRKIKARRIRLKLTAEELGSKVGLTRATVSNIENANQGVTAYTLWRIANELKCHTIDELLPNKSEDPRIVEWLTKKPNNE